MGLGDHVNLQLKRGVKIITCDPQKILIEAETRNGEVITVNAYSYTPTFRWPIPGEKWIVKEENGSWYLDGIYEPQEAPMGERVEPGDTIIGTGSGTIWKNVDGVLEPLVAETGQGLIVTGYREVEEAKELTQYTIGASSNARFFFCNIKFPETAGQLRMWIEIESHVLATAELVTENFDLSRSRIITLTFILPPGRSCIIQSNHINVDEELVYPSIGSLWESV